VIENIERFDIIDIRKLERRRQAKGGRQQNKRKAGLPVIHARQQHSIPVLMFEPVVILKVCDLRQLPEQPRSRRACRVCH
jgi:hypothetical protein